MSVTQQVLRISKSEAAGVVPAIQMFFLLFASYFMLRPVRETMGLVGGVDNIPWLFTATFVATLACLPLFGWLASKVPRRSIQRWTYIFFSINLLLFAAGFRFAAEHVGLARTFYVWLSVFNFISISVAWSLLADLFVMNDAKRMFGLMASGASLGGLVGPLIGALLVASIGHSGLILISAALLLLAILSGERVQAWRDSQPQATAVSDERIRALGGSPWAGAAAVMRSPYLLGIAAFVVLLASVTTFLYLEQARLIDLSFSDRIRQTQVFASIDIVVQTLAILAQIFLTGRLVERLGLRVLLVVLPLVVAAGFIWLAMAPVFAVFVVVMVVRRAGEYALVRPGREMLFTRISPEAKYKAKNFIDTTVYRGSDAVSSWIKAGVDLMGQHPAVVAILGAAVALVWAATGNSLARQAEANRDQLLD
jgi:ATP:ADP antiporter, AAA family